MFKVKSTNVRSYIGKNSYNKIEDNSRDVLALIIINLSELQ